MRRIDSPLRSIWCVWIVLCVALVPSRASQDDSAKLLERVRMVARVGVPGPIAVFGDKAFPVLAGQLDARTRASVIACARFGSGRMTVFGHNGYGSAIQNSPGETEALLRQLLVWTAKSKAKALRVGSLGGAFEGLFRQVGYEVVPLPRGPEPDGVGKLDLIGCGPLSLSAEEASWIRKYVHSGGGLVCGDTPWGWLQVTKGGQIREQPGQHLLADAGLAYADGYLDATAPTNQFDAQQLSPYLNASRAVELLLAVDQGQRSATESELAQATGSLQLALRWLPDGDNAFRDQLLKLVKTRENELVPTPEKPMRVADALSRALLAVQVEQLRRAEPNKVRAHASAAIFPGDVEATAVVQNATIDTSVPHWHSTGAYARPGARIEVLVPTDATRRGLRVRIGCHSDTLWHLSDWHRVPDITTELDIVEKSTLLASAFGGPIYIVAPDGCTLGNVRVQIRGAIAAPHFVLGSTDLAEWKSSIRSRPAPWAEIGSSKLVISVPSRVVRDLDDPAALMEFWDRVLDAQADLVGISRQRPRPERFVCDVQISAGFMHSGYPVMMFLEVAELSMALERLRGGEEIWGFVHELGHNLQRPEWTFEGTGEVTNNVIALYAIEQCCTLAPGKRGHPGADDPPSFEAYAARGALFDEWKKDPFLALSMYVRVRDQFGWEPFKRVFREYEALAPNDRPTDDDERRDQWLVRLSRACGANLGPYFESWGVPTSERARASLVDLPEWLPDAAIDKR